MINHSHKNAFSLILRSRDNQLNPSEGSFLEDHLRSCQACSTQYKIHKELQLSLSSTKRGVALPMRDIQTVTQAIVKIVETKRKVQKTTNFVFAILKFGTAIVILTALLWIVGHELPLLIPSIIKQAPLYNRTATATPTDKVTPTNAINEVRTEVINYVVETGDTIFGIANKFDLKPETILWGNYESFLDQNSVLKPGTIINILPVDGVYYQWKEGDKLTAVATRLGVHPEDIIDWPGNHLKPDSLNQPEIEPGTMLVVPGAHINFPGWNETPYPG